MLPILAIVGRPNVGKSTLFNVLTKTRAALVADEPGLTRDRQVGRGKVGEQPYLVIDTGGLGDTADEMTELVTQQVLAAIQEADSTLFLVDGRSGLTATDETIAQKLRQLNKPIHLVINKTEGLERALVSADFHRLGLGIPYTIAAAHNRGVDALMEVVFAALPIVANTEAVDAVEGVKVAIVGRPNVGKSTLVNRMLGYERVITFDQPGTTRDSIYIPFARDGQQYTLIDTAGVRRRAKVSDMIEKFSILKTLQAIDSANVVIMLLDAQEGITDQDSNLLGNILDSGRALVIAINKWDGLTTDQREQVRYNLDRKLHFIDFAKIHFISALHGSGVGNLFGSINLVWQSASRQIATPRLNHVLQEIIATYPPPLVHGRRVKLRYIHQGGNNPPLFVIHGNQVSALPDSYKNYLINQFRKIFNLEGTPVRVEFKQSENPYEGRKNVLTPRQIQQRQRLMRHVKQKK